jgi:hypothetical protein
MNINDANIVWIAVGLLAVALVIGVSIALSRRARLRTLALRERFGPEYQRTVERYGGREAERVLAARARRVDQIDFRELSDADRSRFTSLWTTISTQFVDDPRAAVLRANELIKEVMRARGYSADTGFEQRAADLSVDHPDVVQHYRAARALSQAGTEQGMNTEDLRQAVVHYRALFADLLQVARADAPPPTLRPAHA